MNSFFKNHRTRTTMIIFFLIIVPLFIFSLYWIRDGIRGLVADIREHQVERVVDERFLKSAQEARGDVLYVEQQPDLVSVFISNDDKAKADLFGQIRDIALAEGNINPRVTIMEAGDTRVSDEDDSLRIMPARESYVEAQIVMSSTYQSFYSFIEKFENMPYASDILSFAIEKPGENVRSLAARRALLEDEVQDTRSNALRVQIQFVVYTEDVMMERDQEINEVSGEGEKVDAETGSDQDRSGTGGGSPQNNGRT